MVDYSLSGRLKAVPFSWLMEIGDMDEHEKKVEAILEENKRYLEIFRKDLQGLSPKTIRNHVANVDFYINDFLLREDANTMDRGIMYIDSFLGDYFIRRCMWSTPATIKSNAASIKKFYKCMKEHGFIRNDQYEYLCLTIKEDMELWLADCEVYNDLSSESPFDIW